MPKASHAAGAALLLWCFPCDPYAACRSALGPLAAAPNLQNPFHHFYVFAKEPHPKDELLALPGAATAAASDPSDPSDPAAAAGESGGAAAAVATRPELVVATESAFEVAPCFKLPVLLLAPVVEALETTARGWATRRALEALAQVVAARSRREGRAKSEPSALPP